jgi:hypothetical protein
MDGRGVGNPRPQTPKSLRENRLESKKAWALAVSLSFRQIWK